MQWFKINFFHKRQLEAMPSTNLCRQRSENQLTHQTDVESDYSIDSLEYHHTFEIFQQYIRQSKNLTILLDDISHSSHSIIKKLRILPSIHPDKSENILWMKNWNWSMGRHQLFRETCLCVWICGRRGNNGYRVIFIYEFPPVPNYCQFLIRILHIGWNHYYNRAQ